MHGRHLDYKNNPREHSSNYQLKPGQLEMSHTFIVTLPLGNNFFSFFLLMVRQARMMDVCLGQGMRNLVSWNNCDTCSYPHASIIGNVVCCDNLTSLSRWLWKSQIDSLPGKQTAIENDIDDDKDVGQPHRNTPHSHHERHDLQKHRMRLFVKHRRFRGARKSFVGEVGGGMGG